MQYVVRDFPDTALRCSLCDFNPKLNFCSGNRVSLGAVSSTCTVLESSHGVRIVAQICTMHFPEYCTDVAFFGRANPTVSWKV